MRATATCRTASCSHLGIKHRIGMHGCALIERPVKGVQPFLLSLRKSFPWARLQHDKRERSRPVKKPPIQQFRRRVEPMGQCRDMTPPTPRDILRTADIGPSAWLVDERINPSNHG